MLVISIPDCCSSSLEITFCLILKGTVNRINGECESELVVNEHVQSFITKLFTLHNSCHNFSYLICLRVYIFMPQMCYFDYR